LSGVSPSVSCPIGLVSAPDLLAYLKERIPKLLKEINTNVAQTPISFPKILDPVPLAER
jgi:hypothetical protein